MTCPIGVMAYIQPECKSKNHDQLEVVYDFKYLGSWIDNTEADLRSRKAEAWRACNTLTKVCKSDLSREIKVRLLGSEKLTKQIDGCYTQLLRTALGFKWDQFLTKRRAIW